MCHRSVLQYELFGRILAAMFVRTKEKKGKDYCVSVSSNHVARPGTM